MPVKSQAQNAAMHEAAEGKSTLGIPKAVGEEYVEASHGENVGALPQHVGGGDPPDHDDDDDESREIKGRADHMLKAGLINAKAHKQVHDHVNNLKKARRPDLKGANMPPISVAGENHASMASGGDDSATKRKGPPLSEGPTPGY